jgi:hypothetical protein
MQTGDFRIPEVEATPRHFISPALINFNLENLTHRPAYGPMARTSENLPGVETAGSWAEVKTI